MKSRKSQKEPRPNQQNRPNSSAIPSHDLGPLLARRAEFRAFLAMRLGGNHADAEDLLQYGFTKALTSASMLRDNERLVPWFYQLLRNALVDHIRTRQAAAHREHRWADSTFTLAPVAATRHLCRCLEPLIASLPATQVELIRRAELGDEPVSHVAQSMGLTSNAASAALHRARANLRAKLVSFCGDCASGACLSCDCDE